MPVLIIAGIIVLAILTGLLAEHQGYNGVAWRSSEDLRRGRERDPGVNPHPPAPNHRTLNRDCFDVMPNQCKRAICHIRLFCLIGARR